MFITVPHSQSVQMWMISLSNQKCPKALFGKVEKHQILRVIHYHFMLGSQWATAGTPRQNIDPVVKGIICTTITNDSPSIKTLRMSLSLRRNKTILWCIKRHRHWHCEIKFCWVHRQRVDTAEWNIRDGEGLQTIRKWRNNLWLQLTGFDLTVQYLKWVKHQAWQNCISSTQIAWKLK